jgi:hypothetical protein
VGLVTFAWQLKAICGPLFAVEISVYDRFVKTDEGQRDKMTGEIWYKNLLEKLNVSARRLARFVII